MTVGQCVYEASAPTNKRMNDMWMRIKRKREPGHTLHTTKLTAQAKPNESSKCSSVQQRQQVFVSRQLGTGSKADPIDLSDLQPRAVAMCSKFRNRSVERHSYEQTWRRISETRGVQELFKGPRKPQRVSNLVR